MIEDRKYYEFKFGIDDHNYVDDQDLKDRIKFWTDFVNKYKIKEEIEKEIIKINVDDLDIHILQTIRDLKNK